MDTLAVIGAVLSQPPPPGGNLMSQIGRAMGMGFMYNKMLDSAEVEQINTSKKQELESRRAAVAEKQVGIQDKRAGFDERRVVIDEAKAPVEIEYLRSRAQAAGLGAKLQEIELKYKNDPARRDLEMRKLQAEVDNLGASGAYTRSKIDTDQDKRRAAVSAQLVKLPPAFDGGTDWAAAAPIAAVNGYKGASKQQLDKARAAFLELQTRTKMTPRQAADHINVQLLEAGYAPIDLIPRPR